MIKILKNNGCNKDNRKAVDWFLAKKNPHWTETDEMAFLAWCGDEKNFADYQELEATWKTLDDLVATEPAISVLPSGENIRFLRKHRLWAGSFVAVAATLALVLITQLSGYDNSYPIILQTTVGQQKERQLKDGSIIVLNTNSRLEVLYTEKKRFITLSKGEALFNVAKNPDRPFIVTAGMTTTRAIGTQFSVYRKEDGNIRIAVVEGIVKVTDSRESGDTGNILASRLAKNEMLTVTPLLSTTGTKPADLPSLLSWQEGVLDFRATSLEQAIAEVNRYSQKKIIIKDDRIKSFMVSGVFKIDDLDTFVSTIENILPVEVSGAESNELYFRKHPSPEKP